MKQRGLHRNTILYATLIKADGADADGNFWMQVIEVITIWHQAMGNDSGYENIWDIWFNMV